MVRVPDNLRHPGLLLDKWHDPWPLKPVKPSLPEGAGKEAKEAHKKYRRAKRDFDEFPRRQLQQVTAAFSDDALLARLCSVLDDALSGRTHRSWRRATTEPLTLHLSRAGSFENAGIALHPLYGFAYLPGSGLKGMARFYARNIARACQADIETVFGRDATKEQKGAAGYVTFYEAWPVKWPKLIVDIVNNHHREYYEHAAPPEDWEQPNPVNFLAVAAGSEFQFRLGLRKPHVEGERLLDLAQSWIDGALEWLGAGAKTNAGYGRFRTQVALPQEAGRATFEAMLTLVSPGFFAGASQDHSDCDLRPASIRGLLRWWWRTLHAGYLTVAELHELEGKLWGLASQEGAIGLSVQPLDQARRGQFSKRGGAGAGGRYYLSYGMEGNPKEARPARCYIEPGARWKLTLIARSVGPWDAPRVLDQAICALWLLSHYGGIGAKCRRGFGSFDLHAKELPADAKACVARAALVHGGKKYAEDRLQSPSVHRMRSATVKLNVPDVWKALDRLGDAYRSFLTDLKHKPQKALLGLPRGGYSHPKDRNYERHASPLHFRLAPTANGFDVRITALYSPNLPNLEASKRYLDKCIEHIKKSLGGAS